MRTAIAAVLLLTTPAFAGSFVAPKGCTTTLTIQSRGCYVSNFYTCSADNPGDQWRADGDEQGPFFLSKIDSETQWLESYDLGPQTTQTLDAYPGDAASFTELMATGYDSFDFSLTKVANGPGSLGDEPGHTNVRGHDALTGKTMVIDGVTLQQTEYEYTETDDAGTVLRHSRGNEYVNADWRTFVSGVSEFEQPDGSWLPLDGSPVTFILPGEPGFAAGQPIFDCSAQMSSLPELLKELGHDHL